MKYFMAVIIFFIIIYGLYKIIRVNLFLDLAIGRRKYKEKKKRKRQTSNRNLSYETQLSKEMTWLDEQMQEEVMIQSREGFMLAGHFIPAALPQRIVIMFHGWRGTWKRDFGMCAREFLDAGCSLLMIEQRAQGKSEGKYIGFGVLERMDCIEWIHFIEKRFGKEIPIYLYGVSMGAATVLMAAGTITSKAVKGVIADSGFISAYDMVVLFGSKFLKIGEYPDVPRVNRLCSKRAGYGFKDYTTLESMKSCTVPVFFIHGTKDDFVPYYMTLVNYHACTAKKQLLLVEGAGHCRSFVSNRDGYLHGIKEFFQWE